MVMAYVDHIRASQANVEKILLLCKQHLVPFYTRCGFTYIGEAEVKHGGYKWFLKILHVNNNYVLCLNF